MHFYCGHEAGPAQWSRSYPPPMRQLHARMLGHRVERNNAGGSTQPVVTRRTAVTDRNPHWTRARTHRAVPHRPHLYRLYAARNPLGTGLPEALPGRFFVPLDCCEPVVRDCAAGGPAPTSVVTMVPRYVAHLRQPWSVPLSLCFSGPRKPMTQRPRSPWAQRPHTAADGHGRKRPGRATSLDDVTLGKCKNPDAPAVRREAEGDWERQ
jgi:hypothetical protein